MSRQGSNTHRPFGPRFTFNVLRLAPWLVFVFALFVYLLTLAPGLSWAHNGADGGDLVAASFSGGIAHPPGYPLYLLLGRAVALLPIGSIPYRYNLFSALTAASAAAVMAWSAGQLAGARGWPAALAGVGAGLMLAFAPLVWEQAVITEVYAFNALLSALVVALSSRVIHYPVQGVALCAAFGLAVSHHLTLVCFLPLVVIRLVQFGRGAGRWGAIAAAGGLLVGLAPLACLPFAARAPVVWGDPSTPAGWWWLVSGQLYRGYAFGLPPDQALPRVAVIARTLVESFTLPGVALGVLGAQRLARRDAPLMWGMALAGLCCAVFAVGYLAADSQVYLVPLLVVFAGWIGAGWGHCVALVSARLPYTARLAQAGVAGLAMLMLLLPAWILAKNWPAVDSHADHEARDFIEGIIAQAPARAVIITGQDRHTFALWVAVFVERPRPDIIVVDQDMLRFDWYRAALRRNFPLLNLAEPSTVDELIEQNADRPLCRPAGQAPPWLICANNL